MKTIKADIRTLFLAFAMVGITGFMNAQTEHNSTTTNVETSTQMQSNPTIEALKKQIEANPKDTESLAKLATEYQNTQSWNLAVDTWKQLTTLLPEWAPAYYGQAYSYQSAKDVDNAKAAYEMYISKVKPEEVENSKQNLAYAYFFVAFSEQQTNPEKAKQFIAKSVEYDPNNQDAVNLNKTLNS